MNKSQRDTYKKLTQNGLGIRRIMKIPNNESKCPNNKNELPIINIKNTKSTFKIHDRNVKDDICHNPFDIPAHKITFGKSMITRKVKPIPFIMSEPKTICDIDENFFKVIEGRPFRHFDDIKVYMRNLRGIGLTKSNAAYLNEKILLTITLNEYELNEYNKIFSLLAETKANFVRFAQQSYNIAHELESMAELISVEIAKINDELEGYCFEYIRMKNQVFSIMYTFEVLVTYGKFLHSISPNSWRIEFDNLNSEINFKDDIYMKQDSQLELLMSMASLDEFKAKASKYSSMPTRIYFREPKQVIKFFENLSQQCRNYMSINTISSKLVKSCIKSRDSLKMAFKEDEDSIQDEIVAMQAELAYMERREIEYMSAFEKLIHNSFYQLYAGRDNVKLFNCLQFVTIQILGDFHDPNDSVSSLMQRIEQEYMEISLAMDYLDLSTVTKAREQMFAHDIIVMKRAHCAQRALKECDILRKCLVASLEPPKPRNKIRPRKSKDAKNVTEKVITQKKGKKK